MIHVFFLSLLFSDVVYPSLDKVGVIIFGVLGLSYLIKYKKMDFHYVEFFFLLYVLYLMVTVLLYDNIGNALFYIVLFMLQYGMLNYILVKKKMDSGYIEKSFFSFINWQSVVALVGVLDFIFYYYGFQSPIRDYTYSWKTDSFYSNPNPFGIMSAMVLSLMMSGCMCQKKLKYFIISVNVLAVLVSGSSMALMLPVVFFVLKIVVDKKILVIMSVAFCFFVFLFSIAVPIDYSDFFNKRLEIWSYGVQMWETSPYIGVGTGNFQIYNYLIPGNDSIDSRYGMHSMFMWLFVETGVFGLLIFLLFVSSVFYFARKYKRDQFLVPLVLVLLVSQVTESFLDHEEIFVMIFWIVIASSMSEKSWYLNERKA